MSFKFYFYKFTISPIWAVYVLNKFRVVYVARNIHNKATKRVIHCVVITHESRNYFSFFFVLNGFSPFQLHFFKCFAYPTNYSQYLNNFFTIFNASLIHKFTGLMLKNFDLT